MKMGLAQGQYSFATAIGILLSIVSLMLVLASNYIAKKISGESLF
jgi:putative aldouronate transport system permease protein